MKKVLFAAFAVFFTSNSYAWEAYEFDISHISTVNDSCRIGMTNLGGKSSNDENICDNPTEILITDCTTERARVQMSIILAAKMNSKRLWHQAIADNASSSCVVKFYSLKLLP